MLITQAAMGAIPINGIQNSCVNTDVRRSPWIEEVPEDSLVTAERFRLGRLAPKHIVLSKGE